MRYVRPATILLSILHMAVLAVAVAQADTAKSREECERQYRPQTGQPGKDVVWVPTNDALVQRMLQMAGTTAADRVFDLGAGDGKIAIAAAKQFGATAVGVEYNPDLARLGQCLAVAQGVADRVSIVNGDVFETDFSSATVVTLYLLPSLNLRLRPTLLKMQPGTRVVSHSFLMDDWEPDERSMTQDGSAYLWIVPAQVSGDWAFRETGGKDAFNVRLKQTFQKIEGVVGTGSGRPLIEAQLKGSQVSLAFEGEGAPVRLVGAVKGDRIEAVATRGSVRKNYIGTRVAQKSAAQ